MDIAYLAYGSTTQFYLWQTFGKDILQGSLNNVWESAKMVNAFKISSNTVHHEDKQVFVCNSIFYTVIYIFMYIYETKISITKFFLGTVVFIINHKINKSFLKAY